MGVSVAMSSQKPWRFETASSGRPAARPAQATSAQMPPPDVPLRATSSWDDGRSSMIRCSTPAVNAVWLPPPWQATAIFVVTILQQTAGITKGHDLGT